MRIIGEEGTELRLKQLEKETEAIQLNQSEITTKVDAIERLNIKQEIILNAILWVARAILGVFITFVASNIFMYYQSINK